MSDRWKDALVGVVIFIALDSFLYFVVLRDYPGRNGAYLSAFVSLPWAQLYRLEMQVKRLKAASVTNIDGRA